MVQSNDEIPLSAVIITQSLKKFKLNWNANYNCYLQANDKYNIVID